jgi:hypothetical protein
MSPSVCSTADADDFTDASRRCVDPLLRNQKRLGKRARLRGAAMVVSINSGFSPHSRVIARKRNAR